MRPGWIHKTDNGLWSIREDNSGRWIVALDGEQLGAYASPTAALVNVISGRTRRPSSGLDPVSCNLPDRLFLWAAHDF